MSITAFNFEKANHSLGFMLWQTTMIWQRLIKKALEPYHVTHPQFVILASLLHFQEQQHDETTQVMLIQWTKLDKMTVSISLKGLVNEAYISKKTSSQDSRAKSVTLTKKGQLLTKKLIPIVEAIDKEFFGVLSKDKQSVLIDAFSHLCNS